MNKNKINQFIAILILEILFVMPFYYADVFATTISNVRVTKTTSSSATIEWSTDILATGNISYGQTSTQFKQKHTNYVTEHSITLTNLNSDTDYMFAVESYDPNNNGAYDTNQGNYYKLKTNDITPPAQVKNLHVVSRTLTSVYLVWDTSTEADFSYYKLYRGSFAISNITNPYYNDTADKSNTYRVSAIDKSGNEGLRSDSIVASVLEPDVLPPVISNVDALSTRDNLAIVTWTTDENSTSFLFINGGEKSDSVLTTMHSLQIDNLEKEKKYSFYVRSCDASNNCANSQNSSVVAGSDANAPFADVIIPRYINRNVIDIKGNTKPGSSVSLFVNNMNSPLKVLPSSQVSTGSFVFGNVQLSGENQIKISITDKAGNINERIFDVSVDTETPTVQLANLSRYYPRTNISISGKVSEPVVVNVFSNSNSNASSVPSKIRGLNTSKISANAIEIKWEESRDRDFSHYVIYRNGVAIAIAKPTNFNLFTDALVDSGKTYTYEVSSINSVGNEGQKSESLVVRVPSGGTTFNLNYPSVDIFEIFSKPLLEFNISGDFTQILKLPRGDATYDLKFVFEDKAGNRVTMERSTTIDTKRPTIKITSPANGAFVYENVAAEVDVIGKTEPNSKVYLYIDRTPFQNFNQTVELSGLPNDILPQIDSLPEISFDVKCRLNLGGNQYCYNADKSTIADSQGNFIFENIDLSYVLGQGSRIRDVPLTDFSKEVLNQESQNSRKADLFILASKPSGLRNFVRNSVRIGNCYSGNLSWDVVPLTEFQSPTFLNSQRIAEGAEALYFYYNFSYIGRGTNPQITRVSIKEACSSKEFSDSRFNVSCSMFRGANPVAVNPPDKTVWYSTAQLARIPGMDRFLENDWKSFAKSVDNELTFPLILKISYKHDVIDYDGNAKTINEVQTTCDQVSYVLDNTLIDPRSVMPDWILFDFVDYLENSIKVLSEIQEKIDKLIDYVGQACLWTYISHTVVKIYRTWVDLTTEFSIRFKTQNQDDQDCVYIVDRIKTGGMRLKDVSDPDLKKCFQASYNAWQKETNLYEWQRWSCDRIFGHSAPGKWTEDETDDKLHDKLEEQDKCKTDESVQGQSLRLDRCSIFANTYPKARDLGIDEKCVEVWVEQNKKKALYLVGDKVGSSNVYELTLVDGFTKTLIYAVKDERNEHYLITSRPKTCDEVCGASKDKENNLEISIVNTKTQSSRTILSNNPLTKKGEEKDGFCIKTSICNSLASAATNKEEKARITIQGKPELVDVKSAAPRGYTSDCFYNSDDPKTKTVDSVGKAETRVECCCVNSKGIEETVYYEPTDVTKYSSQPAHETKSEGFTSITGNGYSNMDFSYRYQRLRFETKGTDESIHNAYNPNRYIEGRDVYACFGQDALIKGKDTVIINPFKQHLATFQCAYIVGVNQRLKMVTNIMSALSSCLIDVRKSGMGDAGVCKELFTQHVCNAIWQSVRFFMDGCDPEGTGSNAKEREDGWGENLKLGFKGIANAVSESQQEVSEEYGNAKLNNLLGIGEGGVARKACLAAFGYDWDINVRNLVDAAYTSPFATLVQPIIKSREYLTVDPISLRAKYDYRTSWFINPGCDIENYRVDLVCVGQREINENPEINCGAVGAPSFGGVGSVGTSTAYNQCDCKDLPEGKSNSFFTGARLKQNQVEDKSFGKVIDDNYRYDHLKFTLRPDTRIPQNIRQNCFPPGYEDGVFYSPINDRTAKDIAACSVNPLSGVYTCNSGASFTNQKGIVQVQQITVNDIDSNKKDELRFEVGTYLKVGLTATKTGKDKCVKFSLQPDPVNPIYESLSIDGLNEIPQIEFPLPLAIISQNSQITNTYVDYQISQQVNTAPVTINLDFRDNPLDAQGKTVYSEDDTIIIDGLQIDLKDPKGKIEYTNGLTTIRILTNPNAGDARVKKIISISRQGAQVDIRNVNYLLVPLSNPQVWQLTQPLTIYPAQHATDSSQQKTLLVEIFNIKDTSDIYTDWQDCNLNDRAIEPRKINIVVTTKGVPAQELATSIGAISYSPRTPLIGQEVTISSKITHATGIKNAKISIVPLGGGTKLVDNEEMKPSNGDIWTYNFKTQLKPAGKYTVTIYATSNNDKSNPRSDSTLELTTTPGTPTVAPPGSAAPAILKAELLGQGSITYLRNEVRTAFEQMKLAAKAEGFELKDISAHRSFNDQLRIWNDKFNSFSGTDQEKLSKTMDFSAVPGLSRHHWATEIDINGGLDGSLNPIDYQSGGKYFNVYTWLKNNAGRFGFCQPYDIENCKGGKMALEL